MLKVDFTLTYKNGVTFNDVRFFNEKPLTAKQLLTSFAPLQAMKEACVKITIEKISDNPNEI